MAKTSNIGFKELDAKLDRVIDAMATKEDIRRLEDRIENVEKIQRDILVALDSLATTIVKLNIEYASIVVQLSRHERWFKEVAEKTGLNLEA